MNGAISLLKSKIGQLCGVAYRLRDKFNQQAARNFYYGCVYSLLSYCIAVWGGVTQCTRRCEALDRLHTRTVNNLFSKFCEPGECILENMKILKLPDIYRLRVATYMYKVLKNNMYPSLQSSLDLSYPDHGYPTRSSSLLVTPFPRVEAVRMNYGYQFKKVWNTIPEWIKSLQKLTHFKRALQSQFLEGY